MIENAVVEKVIGTAFVYVRFAKTNDPNAPKTLKGKLRYQPQNKSKYREGNQIRIRVLRYHADEQFYDVSL